TAEGMTRSPADTAAPGGGPPPDGPPPSSGRYVLGEEIARGGMGVVYRATDTVLNREVAVKVLADRFGANPGAARRFADEAQISGQLQHPGIPPVHDLGTLPGGRPFLAMKLIKGRTLADLLGDRPDPSADRGRFVAIVEQVCQAVAYAHAHKVIHRDLKPHNVMVGAFGEVQVMDWGLAKILGDRPAGAGEPAVTVGTEIRTLREPDDGFTQAGSVLGTPAYMSREQAIGAVDQVDARSDVFGLGAVLYEVLTGAPPYAGPDREFVRQQAAVAKLDGAFARLDACGAEPGLVALCKRCLAAEPGDRPADAGEVARAVAGLRQAADERARRAELERVRADGDRRAAELAATAERRRRRVVLAAAGAVAAVLAAGVGVSAWQAVRATDAERQARQDRDAAQAAEAKAVERQLREKAAREVVAAAARFMTDVFALGSPRRQVTPDRRADRDMTVREAMDYAARTIGDRFPDRPEVEAEVRTILGRTYRELAAYPEADRELGLALAIRE